MNLVEFPNVEPARKAVRDGGIIAYPTEAVYGLGCDPLDERAVARLIALKQRPADKGLILIANHFLQLEPFCGVVGNAAWRRVKKSWPGPYTWVFPAAAACPSWLRGERPGIAVRVTAHPVAAALCDACNCALVSTSANVSDAPAARSASQVEEAFGDKLDCIVVGDTGGMHAPTSIRDAMSGRGIR